MNKPLHQKLIENIVYVIVIVFAIFGCVDGLSSSIDFMTISKAKWGSLIALFFGCFLYLYLRYISSITWKEDDGKNLTFKGLTKKFYLTLIAFLLALWFPILLKIGIAKEEVKPNNEPVKVANSIPTDSIESIFKPNDTRNFNVLIIRFEDIILNEKNYCIGRSIQENLNVIQAKENPILKINAYYEEKIPPPSTLEKAKNIQKKHNADLIIYGLVKNVVEGCRSADVCFRYNIDDNVVAQIAPAINPRTTKHELDYVKITPFELQKGVLQIDSLLLKNWIISLVKVKANLPDEAFLELSSIANSPSNVSNSQKAKSYRNIGTTYLNLNQEFRALEAFNKAISLDKSNKLGFWNRGLVHFSLGNLDKAIQDYNKSIKLDSTLYFVFYNRAMIYSEMGNYNLAVRDYNTSLTLNPDFAFALYNRAMVYGKLEKYDLAVRDLEKYIRINPEDSEGFYELGAKYTYIKNNKKAIENYSKAILLNKNYFEAYNNRGTIYAELGEYNKALADFTTSISINPKYIDSYINRSNVYSELGRIEKGILDCNKVISLDSNNYLALVVRARLYANLKQYKLTEKDVQRAINLNSSRSEAYFVRGLSFSYQKNYQLAITNYSKGISLDSSYQELFHNRGLAYTYLKDYASGIKDFSKSIELTPTYWESYRSRGMCYFYQRQFHQAIKDFNNAISLEPNNEELYNIRGNAYNYVGKYDLAHIDFNRAIKMNPGFISAYVNRGLTFKNQKEYQLALQDYNQAILLSANNDFIPKSKLYNNRGYIYLKLNKLRKSREDLELAQQLAENNLMVYVNWACYYSVLNKKDLAIRNLKTAIQMGYKDVERLKSEEELSNIRELPEFLRIIKLID